MYSSQRIYVALDTYCQVSIKGDERIKKRANGDVIKVV